MEDWNQQASINHCSYDSNQWDECQAFKVDTQGQWHSCRQNTWWLSRIKGQIPSLAAQESFNSDEHCMIERDGAKLYWCEDGHLFEYKPCRMYCMHKPGDGHLAWLRQNKSLRKTMLQRRVKLPLLCLLHYLCLRQLLLPQNLTLANCQSFPFEISLVSNDDQSGYLWESIQADLRWSILFIRKLHGPKLRRETIMNCFLLPFIFSFWATISILLLLQQLLLATILFTVSLFKQVIQWILFVTCLFFTTRLGQTIWSFLLTVLCIVFIVPIVFHSFYKSVYDFGPKHRKWSFWEILTQTPWRISLFWFYLTMQI